MNPPLQQALEALIFCSKQPLSLDEIQHVLATVYPSPPSPNTLNQALKALKVAYEDSPRPLALHHTGGGYQFLTKKNYAPLVQALFKEHNKRKLSKTALETLAIIAYKQPITANEIEKIRGVHADYSLKKLLTHNLIVIQGKAAQPGNPLLYTTSQRFLDFFGINTLQDLPSLAAYEKNIGR